MDVLEDIKLNLNSKAHLEDILKNIDLKDFFNGLMSELYKIELAQTSFSLFLNLSADFVGTLDKDGNLIMMEGAWTKTIGWEYEELLNIIHPDYRDDFKDKLKSVDVEIDSIENKVKCKDGQYKWLRWNMKYLKGMDLIILTVRDVSVEKEEERRRKKND